MSQTKKSAIAKETKCKNIQGTLQKENNILEEMLNETENMHIVFLDRDFNFVRVNEAYAKTCGYKPEEMIGKNHFALYPGEEVEAIFKRVRDTGLPIRFHDRPFVFPDQSERGVTYWDWTLKPVKNEAGEVEGLVFSLVETTERMKAEETLQEQGVAISSAPDAIFSTDSSFVIKSWNKAAERIFGWTAEEVVGKASTSIFNIKYPTLNGVSRKRALKKLMDTGFWKGEVIYRKKGGSPVPVSVSVSLVKDKDDNVTGTVAVVHDISKRKRREEAMKRTLNIARQRAEELEELQVKLEEKSAEVEEYATNMEQLAKERADKLKDAERLAAIGATAGMVGHDIRNPLQAIMGDLYLIASDVASFPEGEEKESVKESIAAIRKNTDYINKIIQDLQYYAKSHKPDSRRVDLEEIFQKLFVETDFPENVEAKYCVEEEAREIVADPALVERIIRNLVINAVQAMPEGGKLEIQSRQENGAVAISVQDSGVGVPDYVKDKLFTPLFTTKAKGQGFGLPVVKRLTEALGGTVTFESEKGKGTKFTVHLPIAKK